MLTASWYTKLPDSCRMIGISRSAPRGMAKAYCERKGWEIAATYVEPGASALDDDRPFFQEMIAAATSPERPYDHVVVHSLSRFSRDVLDSALYGRKLEKAGVTLVSITQDLADDGNGKLIRTILNAFDEHQSRENAKHTHRAMMENARQGFWNGSRPPFGYAVAVKERRGNKDKKVLVVNADEAPVVRQVFDLYLGRHGRAMGLKAICNHLNERGISRRGHKWGIGSLQDLMTSPTYCGRHKFNRLETRTGRRRPPSECIEVEVPAIISEDDFDRVQAALHERAPRQTPPRVVNGPTMLAGVVRCAHCGAAMVLNTGKGVYRYYACSSFAKKGRTACVGQRIRMDRLDDMVLEYLGSKVFDPDRLQQVLKTYMETQEVGATARKERLRQFRDRRGEVQAGRARLITMVESGAIEADDPTLKERLGQLKMQATELDTEIVALQSSLLAGVPTMTPERVRLLAGQMRERFRSGPPDLRQAYMRLLLNSVEVGPDAITLSGSNAILERLAANGASSNAPEVISFAQKWRPQRETMNRSADAAEPLI
jgi:DNA invertase Pin-like site-specific DNA recombinase